MAVVFANILSAEGGLSAIAEILVYLVVTTWLLGELLQVLVIPDESDTDTNSPF